MGKSCKCGKPASSELMGQGGMGICFVSVCDECLANARRLAAELLEVTGLEEYAVPPQLRPTYEAKP
jgi:hypothetical protein